MQWFKPAELTDRLRMPVVEIRALCSSRQIAWRPANPNAKNTRYLISEQAVADYERATTRQATIRPLRRAS